MNDSVMYTWDVKVAGSHGYGILFRCARKETAEYLRDWCEAEEENSYRSATPALIDLVGKQMVDRMRNGLDIFSIDESEVIL